MIDELRVQKLINEVADLHVRLTNTERCLIYFAAMVADNTSLEQIRYKISISGMFNDFIINNDVDRSHLINKESSFIKRKNG